MPHLLSRPSMQPDRSLVVRRINVPVGHHLDAKLHTATRRHGRCPTCLERPTRGDVENGGTRTCDSSISIESEDNRSTLRPNRAQVVNDCCKNRGLPENTRPKAMTPDRTLCARSWCT